MTISYTESIRGYPYMEKQQLSEEFKMSVQTIKGRVQEIESEIEKGRYDDFAIIRDGKLLRINVLVFIDYMTYRRRLLDKNARQYVPEFHPEKMVRSIGWNNRIVYEDV